MLERQMSAGNRLVLALGVSYPKCGFSEISLKTATTQNEEVYIQSLPRGGGWEIQQTKEQQFVNEKDNDTGGSNTFDRRKSRS